MKWIYFVMAVAFLAIAFYELTQGNVSDFRHFVLMSMIFQLFANIEQFKQNRK